MNVQSRTDAPASSRREQLLDAALELFGERGVDATSMKDLARAAGVAPGLTYHYFEGKDALVTALLTERGFLPQLEEMVAGYQEVPAARALPAIAASFDALLAANDRLLKLFMSSGRSEVRQSLEELSQRGMQTLAGYLRSRSVPDGLDADGLETAARVLFATLAIGRFTGNPADPESVANLILHGLELIRK